MHSGLSDQKKIRQRQGIHAGGSQMALEDLLNSAKTFEIRNLLSFQRILERLGVTKGKLVTHRLTGLRRERKLKSIAW